MGKFLIRNGSETITFHLKAGNGGTIGISKKFSRKSDCYTAIETLSHYAPTAPVEDQTRKRFFKEDLPKFQIFRKEGSSFYFRFLSPAGEELFSSQPYTSKASCQNGITSVKLNAPSAEVDESFL